MFWRPDHVEQSPWLDHLPWVFWLLEALAPQRCVTLGARKGSPHLAFCQGVGRLGLDAECLLVARENEGGSEIHAMADRRYGDLASRLNIEPLRGFRQLGQGSIDILAVDMAPDDEDLEDVIERWLSRVSERGVVLIPGINRREPGCVAHDHFTKLQAAYRSLTFHQGDGLGVLLVGEQLPELLETLASRWNVPAAARTVREVFARLGRACVDQALADAQTARLHSVKERLETVEQERLDRVALLAQLQTQIKERDEDLASLESDKLHLAEENADSQRTIQTLQVELGQLRAELAEKDSACQKAEQRCRELETTMIERDALIAEKDANIQTRFQELATMTNIAEEADRQQDYFKRKAETYNQRNEDKKAELKQFRRTYAKLQRELDTRSEEASSFKAKIEKLEQELEKRDKSLADRFDELGSLTAVLEERERELADLKDEGSSQVVRASRFFGARPHGIRLKTTNRKDQERKRRKQQEALAELEASEWFDSLWYLKQYPDIASDDRYSTNPALHYLKFGGFEGRDPSPYFDSAGYLEAYPDVALTEINPLLHFIRDGIKEGRSPRP
jgi:hypothetical protein